MKRDNTEGASSHHRQARTKEHGAIASHDEAMQSGKARDYEDKNREAARRRRLTTSNLNAIMTPGVRYTCVALADRLNSSTRQVKASLSQLVDAGAVRHVQEARTGLYWVPTHEEKERFEQKRNARRQLLGHTLEGYDADLRRLESLCMLVRRS